MDLPYSLRSSLPMGLRYLMFQHHPPDPCRPQRRKTRPVRSIFLVIALLVTSGGAQVIAATPKVVATIRPLHFIATAITAGVSQPELLLHQPGSVHHFQLRPSQVKLLNQASIIVWIGPGLELPLSRYLNTNRPGVVTVQTLTGLKRLRPRSAHGPASHRHSDTDPHLWLDPENARIIATAITDVLSRQDPLHRPQYQKNREEFMEKLQSLKQWLRDQAAQLPTTPFLVYHDAYQYLENVLGIRAVSAVYPGPTELLSAKSGLRLRHAVQKHHISCLLVEVNTPVKALNTVFGDSAPALAYLDPLGTTLTANPDAYFEMIKNNTTALATCLRDHLPQKK